MSVLGLLRCSGSTQYSVQLFYNLYVLWQISKFGTTELCQGRTMRWALGWTFEDDVVFKVCVFTKDMFWQLSYGQSTKWFNCDLICK